MNTILRHIIILFSTIVLSFTIVNTSYGCENHIGIIEKNECLSKADDLALSTAKKDKLFLWLAKPENSSKLTAFLDNPKMVRAWSGVSEFPNIRKDMDFLGSFSIALDDVDIVGINIGNRVKDWIQISHLKCRTCANGVEPFLDEVLDNLYGFKAYISPPPIPGSIKVIDDIAKSTKGAIGVNWVMRFTIEKGINPSAFEEIITTGRKFTADIVEGAGTSIKYFECKSWDSSMKSLFALS